MKLIKERMEKLSPSMKVAVKMMYTIIILLTIICTISFVFFCLQFSWDASYKEYCELILRFTLLFFPYLVGMAFVHSILRVKIPLHLLFMGILALICLILSCLSFSWNGSLADSEYTEFFKRTIFSIIILGNTIFYFKLPETKQEKDDQEQVEQEKTEQEKDDQEQAEQEKTEQEKDDMN